MRAFLLVLLTAIFIQTPQAATTAVSLSLSGSGTAGLVPSGYSFNISGTGTVSPLGSVTFTGMGTAADLNQPITGMIVLTFTSGGTLNLNFSIPLGILFPLGNDTGIAAGSASIVSGTGPFAGATGSFPSITGSGTATGITSSNFQLKGDGTIVLPTPTVPTISANGVVSAIDYGGFKTIAPGTWIEIYGTNLSTTTRSWGSKDFSADGRTAPTSLDGVKVTVGGQAAFVDYVSPGQINALVASNSVTGASQLTVTNSLGTSAPYSISIASVAPGLLAPASLQAAGKQYVGALAPTGQIVGSPTLPVRAGDTLTIYGIGFGPVTPRVDAGTVASDVTSLNTPPQILFGTALATLKYYGLTPGFTGLYQFNVVVPAVAANTAVPLTLTLGGIMGAQTLYIAVQQ